jgi:hypothetical protein
MSKKSAADEFGRQRGQSVILTFRPAVFDRHVVTFDKTGLIQALVERRQVVRKSFAGSSVEEPDHRHRWHPKKCP